MELNTNQNQNFFASPVPLPSATTSIPSFDGSIPISEPKNAGNPFDNLVNQVNSSEEDPFKQFQFPMEEPAKPVKAPESIPQESTGIFLDIKANKNLEISGGPLHPINVLQEVNDWLANFSSVRLEEKLLFFQLLASMIGAGLPIIDSLNLLIRQTKNQKLKKVIEDMKMQIESGESLASALRNNNDVFDEATCSVVEAGEKSGKLNEILKELVNQYEQLDKITKKIKAVMMYPLIIVIVMIILTIVVLIFVVPKLQDLFGGAENLPLPTRVLITGSHIVTTYWLPLLVATITGFVFFRQWKRSKEGGRQWNTLLLAMPIFGDLFRKMILTRVTRIFGFLISAGVPVVDSLKIASHITDSQLYQDKLLLAADDLTKGISIAENLSDDETLFPQMLVNMMAIGEKTASLDTVMGKAADFYNEELERKVGNLSKLMEPVILGIIACGAVFMILAIYLPILKMNDQVVSSF